MFLLRCMRLLFLLSTNFVFLTKAYFNVTVIDSTLTHSPRLYAASSVTYNNALYVYGGRTAFTFNASNNMYKYSINQGATKVYLESVHQANEGPNCSFCGAVMINAHQMMILTRPDTMNDEVVQPYLFDFTTNSWMVNETIPYYDISLKSVFRARQGHSTILSMNGTRIYTIGGNSSSTEGETLTSAWYFDLQNYSYHIVEGLPPTNDFALYGSAVNLLDGNIGVLFGTSNTLNPNQYLSPNDMLVIDVWNNTWRNKYQYIGGDNADILYGLSAAWSSNNTRFVYFTSGCYASEGGSKHRTRSVSILDLKTYRWLETNETYETGSSVDFKYFTVAAILNDSIYINALGTHDDAKSMEKRSVNLFHLPLETNSKKVDEYVSENSLVNIVWKSSLSTPYNDGISKDARIAFYIILFVSSGLFIAVLVIVVKSVDVRTNPTKQQRFTQLYWGGKVADIAMVRNLGFFTTLLIVSLLALAVGFLAYNVVHSPISILEESSPVKSINMPDIRVCYSGWKSNPTPKLSCQFNIITPDTPEIFCSQHIIELDSSIHIPTLAGRDDQPTCYMFISSNQTYLSTYTPTIQLYHKGRSYSDSEAVFVQFFEPSKNPIRKLYNIHPEDDTSVFTVNDIDLWLDSEAYSGEQSDVADKVFVTYPDSKVSAQFETIYTLKVPNNDDWSTDIGLFTAQRNVSSLSVTHSDVIARHVRDSSNATSDNLGYINISPKAFVVKTVTESHNNTALSALGTLGGLIGVASGLYVFLFGTSPSHPWGWIQRRNHDKQMRKLVEYFDMNDGQHGRIPFVSPVHPRFSAIFNKNHRDDDTEDEGCHFMDNDDNKVAYYSEDLKERVAQLEARNQILELVLRAYYMDDEIFRELKNAKSIV